MDSNLEYTASDYLAAFRRRRGVTMAVAAPIVAIALGFTLLLPDKYTSFAEIAVDLEGAKVRTLEPIEVSTYADQYIATLEDRALAGDNLLALANDPDLFSTNQDGLTEADRIDEIRQSIKVSVQTQLVLSPKSGREVDLISGFKVASVAHDPHFAFQVADYVSELFFRADRESRTEQASSTLSFLNEQITITENEIRDLEKEVADFKVANACCLPELGDLNMSVIQRAERDIEQIQPRIRALEQDRIFLQAQLDEIGQLGMGADRLAELEREYMALVANYGPDHPDVNRVRREIIGISNAEPGSDGALELIELRMKLIEAERKYSSQHPDVIRYKRELAALESKSQSGGSRVRAQLIDNPRYNQLRAEINSIDTQLTELRRRQPLLRQKISDYEDRLARTPQIESEYQGLNRRLKSARDNFEDLQRRLVIARQSEALEATDIGARLAQVVPAVLPTSPSGPPRTAIFVIGVFLAGILGIAASLFTEMTDSTVRGSKDVALVMDMVPLATIPVIENSMTMKTRQRRVTLIRGTMILLSVAIALLYFT